MPLFLLTSILILCFIGAPVTFTQYRPGKNGKLFAFVKFRTMKNTRDVDGNLLPDRERVTKFGNFLRKTSLDEIPQLFMIFTGKMSFVGPRPRMLEEIVFLNDEQLKRQQVRPGITGLAQINGRNNINFDKVVEFDRIYIKKMSFWLDVKILFQTIGKVFEKEGINKQGTVSNEFYGDYLLRTKQISEIEYAQKIKLAHQILSKYEKVHAPTVVKVEDEVEDLKENFQ
jgi:lipopolysaccharide/colanic/teichoic acid biosynthesis glycosyltransferase